ncbi:hypothetical protein Kisp01_70650 [Kineosporia sp. NBRC 101677]|uniref:hypothetical protein n=1 Tax=Kineosporia sp. NBRC 101677 TaxID=3032197 RepID=UPI0024A3A735|nr:hypothetical protein [Kineosporia sp. NBRC 101677]GLY20051.1 hypothetical protein Kisp01_70650 [Kineosporia sp. NBRC 101677]
MRVFQLRRAGRTSSQPAGARQWRHSWVVGVHKVRQLYPSEQRRKMIYCGPYSKGPCSKLMISDDVVRALSANTYNTHSQSIP